MANKALFNFVAGAAVGTLLGILFAPAKGAETRRKIFKTTDDVADSVKTVFSDFVETIKDIYTGIFDEVEDEEKRLERESRFDSIRTETKLIKDQADSLKNALS